MFPCLFANLPTTITATNTIDLDRRIESQNDQLTSPKLTLHNEPKMIAGRANVPMNTPSPLVCSAVRSLSLNKNRSFKRC